VKTLYRYFDISDTGKSREQGQEEEPCIRKARNAKTKVAEENHGSWRSEVFMVISEFGTSGVLKTKDRAFRQLEL
jgi:hypothetical protein